MNPTSAGLTKTPAPSEFRNFEVQGYGYTNLEFIQTDEAEWAATAELSPTGSRGMIVVGSTRIFSENGKTPRALGGLRAVRFEDEEAQFVENLQLAGSVSDGGGMAAKNAVVALLDSRLIMGGGKSTISVAARLLEPEKKDALMKSFGVFQGALEHLQKSKYISAEDMNISEHDVHGVQDGLKLFANAVGEDIDHYARYVTLTAADRGGYGNPAPYTARGVMQAMIGALAAQGIDSLAGVKVLVHGCGNVGRCLAQLLVEKDARVFLSDPHPDPDVARINMQHTMEFAGGEGSIAGMIDTGTETIPPDLSDHSIDVFAPCARRHDAVPEYYDRLKTAKLICGAENNIFRHSDADSKFWAEKGIVVVPDYLANLGGVTLAIAEHYGVSIEEVTRIIDQQLPGKTEEIVRQAIAEGVAPLEVVDAKVDELLGR